MITESTVQNEKQSKKNEEKTKKDILYFTDLFIYTAVVNLKLMQKNFSLFFGSFLLVLGIFSFESDKYCDGNTSDYLSCTRPTTYYYYDGVDIALIIVGLFLIMIWVLKRSSKR